MSLSKPKDRLSRDVAFEAKWPVSVRLFSTEVRKESDRNDY